MGKTKPTLKAGGEPICDAMFLLQGRGICGRKHQGVTFFGRLQCSWVHFCYFGS